MCQNTSPRLFSSSSLLHCAMQCQCFKSSRYMNPESFEQHNPLKRLLTRCVKCNWIGRLVELSLSLCQQVRPHSQAGGEDDHWLVPSKCQLTTQHLQQSPGKSLDPYLINFRFQRQTHGPILFLLVYLVWK